MTVMETFTTYRPSGEIVATITCPSVDVESNTPVDCQRIEGFWNGAKYWVENGEPVEKVEMEPIVFGLTISNLPIPCTAYIEAARYEITDGVLELNPSLPGPYQVRLEAVPYLSKTVTVA